MATLPLRQCRAHPWPSRKSQGRTPARCMSSASDCRSAFESRSSFPRRSAQRLDEVILCEIANSFLSALTNPVSFAILLPNQEFLLCRVRCTVGTRVDDMHGEKDFGYV